MGEPDYDRVRAKLHGIIDQAKASRCKKDSAAASPDHIEIMNNSVIVIAENPHDIVSQLDTLYDKLSPT